MGRVKSILEIDASITTIVENGIFNEGSNLSGVSCECIWSDRFIPRKFFYLLIIFISFYICIKNV